MLQSKQCEVSHLKGNLCARIPCRSHMEAGPNMRTVDARGQACPQPVILARKAMADSNWERND